MTSRVRADLQERVPAFVYKLRILSADPKGLARPRAVLLGLSVPEEDLVFSETKGRATIEVFHENRRLLAGLKKLLAGFALPGVTLRLDCLEPKDWLTRWKRRWKPAALTAHLDVVPVWCLDQYKPHRGRDYILMDTLLSFGTGLHETTRMMARFIEGKRGEFKSFFDIGTGTGILSFVALKHGATRVFAIDIGALSIQAAKDNMKVNKRRFEIRQADIRALRSTESFDFVAANLITEDLLGNADRIVKFVRAGGFLAVSGISLEHLGRLRKAFARLPLVCLEITKGDQWSGLLYQKKM